VRRCGSEHVASLGVGAFVGSAEGWPGTLRQKPGFAPGNLLYAVVAPIPVLDCGRCFALFVLSVALSATVTCMLLFAARPERHEAGGRPAFLGTSLPRAESASP
jgi:hypothetical protein